MPPMVITKCVGSDTDNTSIRGRRPGRRRWRGLVEGARVTDQVKGEVAKRMQKELESGFTVRSDDPLDFTTFGELGEILKNNWDVFGSMLNDRKAVKKIMGNLNTLRGPIAHCSELAEDEEIRLRLSVRDWFRQLAGR